MKGVPQSDGLDDDDDGDGGIFAEINITPLTDVFLVLLIILMVVSSSLIEDEKSSAYQQGLLAERALQVMTPDGGKDADDLVPEDVIVSVLPDHTVFVNNDEIPAAQLDTRFNAIHEADPRTRIVLRGDKSASYEVVMDVMSRLTRSGLTNIALAMQDN